MVVVLSLLRPQQNINIILIEFGFVLDNRTAQSQVVLSQTTCCSQLIKPCFRITLREHINGFWDGN